MKRGTSFQKIVIIFNIFAFAFFMINGFINEERNDYSAQHPTFAIIFILLMVLIFVLYGSSMIFALILARTSKQLSDSEKLRWTILIILLGPIGISLFLWTQGRNAGTRKHV